MREEEKRFERHQRPFELAAFGEVERRLAGEQRPRIDAARDGVELRPLGPQPAHYGGGGKAGEVADRCQAPAGERLAQPELGRETRERQRGQKAGFAAGRDDARLGVVRRLRGTREGARGVAGAGGALGGHLRGELAAGDADPGRESGAPCGGDERPAELALRRPVRCVPGSGTKAPGEAVGVEEEEPRSGDLDARREALGDLGERLLGGTLAGAVAVPRRELRHQGARLGERHAGRDAEAAGGAGGGDDLGRGAVAGGHGERLSGELGLGPRRAASAKSGTQRQARRLMPGAPGGALASAGRGGDGPWSG